MSFNIANPKVDKDYWTRTIAILNNLALKLDAGEKSDSAFKESMNGVQDTRKNINSLFSALKSESSGKKPTALSFNQALRKEQAKTTGQKPKTLSEEIKDRAEEIQIALVKENAERLNELVISTRELIVKASKAAGEKQTQRATAVDAFRTDQLKELKKIGKLDADV